MSSESLVHGGCMDDRPEVDGNGGFAVILDIAVPTHKLELRPYNEFGRSGFQVEEQSWKSGEDKSRQIRSMDLG